MIVQTFVSGGECGLNSRIEEELDVQYHNILFLFEKLTNDYKFDLDSFPARHNKVEILIDRMIRRAQTLGKATRDMAGRLVGRLNI